MFQTSRNGELELLTSPDADIYLQGAHLTRFRDWLFLSDESNFAAGKSIRGGVPIIFPWFGPSKADADLPQHGWARNAMWVAEAVADDAVTLAIQSHRWQVRMKFEMGEQLRMRFEVENQSDNAQSFECALHTYFAVDDARNVMISGLDGKTYLDKTEDYTRVIQSGDISLVGQTDRVYLDAPGPVAIHDGVRTIHIAGQSGWRSTVVWNPWERVAAGIEDLSEWRNFVCVECGAIADDAITLQAGENYALDITIRAE